jgi:hypothetical protein
LFPSQSAQVLPGLAGDGSIGSRLRINPGTVRVTIQGTDILLGGDVILSINNIGVVDPCAAQSLGSFTSDENYEGIYNNVATLKAGDTLVVTIFREGQSVEVDDDDRKVAGLCGRDFTNFSVKPRN